MVTVTPLVRCTYEVQQPTVQRNGPYGPPAKFANRDPEGRALSAISQSKELAIVAATAAADKLATDVVAIDVSSHLALSDVFVVCSANNERQLSAIVDNVEDELRRLGQKPLHTRRSPRRELVAAGLPGHCCPRISR